MNRHVASNEVSLDVVGGPLFEGATNDRYMPRQAGTSHMKSRKKKNGNNTNLFPNN